MTDMIVFAEDWGAHPSSTQHLITHLPQRGRTVWVNSIGMRRPRLDMADARRALRKLTAAFRRQAPVRVAGPAAPGPVVQPVILPLARSRLGRAVNRALLARKVGGAARTAGLDRPVLWLSLPSAIDAVGALDEACVVYYCGDDFGALEGVDHALCLAMEAELAGRADLILAASPQIAARFPAAKTHVLPHGVDYDLFATPAPRAADLPDGLCAGFYGTLAAWLDYDLIAAAARALPHWTFVFVGHVAADISAIAGLPNVRLLGPRAHSALPGYAQHWTVSLIPFRDTPQIRACNPLKLREYLAAGSPIAATPFPALQPYAAHVTQVTDADGLVAALLNGVTDPPAARQARQACVAAEGWQARADTAARLIGTLCA